MLSDRVSVFRVGGAKPWLCPSHAHRTIQSATADYETLAPRQRLLTADLNGGPRVRWLRGELALGVDHRQDGVGHRRDQRVSLAEARVVR